MHPVMDERALVLTDIYCTIAWSFQRSTAATAFIGLKSRLSIRIFTGKFVC